MNIKDPTHRLIICICIEELLCLPENSVNLNIFLVDNINAYCLIFSYFKLFVFGLAAIFSARARSLHCWAWNSSRQDKNSIIPLKVTSTFSFLVLVDILLIYLCSWRESKRTSPFHASHFLDNPAMSHVWKVSAWHPPPGNAVQQWVCTKQ